MPDDASTSGLRTHPDGLDRCWWCGDDSEYVAYHDREWGVAVHDDVRLFEKLALEGFQAGLSWRTILRKRDAFRRAFAGFVPEAVAGFDEHDVQRLLEDAGIVRHRGKIEAVIANARAYTGVVEVAGSLDAFVWAHAPTTHRAPSTIADIPATTPEATALARDLKRVGFRFVGPTTCYAFMQSMGLVDDHLIGCAFRDPGGSGSGRPRR